MGVGDSPRPGGAKKEGIKIRIGMAQIRVFQ